MIIKKALFGNVPLEYQGELLSNLANKFMDHEEEDQEEDGNQEEEEDHDVAMSRKKQTRELTEIDVKFRDHPREACASRVNLPQW